MEQWYRRRNNELRRETDIAKEKYFEDDCKEIIELQRKEDTTSFIAKLRR